MTSILNGIEILRSANLAREIHHGPEWTEGSTAHALPRRGKVSVSKPLPIPCYLSSFERPYYRDDDHHVKISGDLSFFSGIITSTSAFHNFREQDNKVADDYIKDFEDELVPFRSLHGFVAKSF